jgi:hypothetical protein
MTNYPFSPPAVGRRKLITLVRTTASFAANHSSEPNGWLVSANLFWHNAPPQAASTAHLTISATGAFDDFCRHRKLYQV